MPDVTAEMSHKKLGAPASAVIANQASRHPATTAGLKALHSISHPVSDQTPNASPASVLIINQFSQPIDLPVGENGNPAASTTPPSRRPAALAP
jgi:hypothetical protein